MRSTAEQFQFNSRALHLQSNEKLVKKIPRKLDKINKKLVNKNEKIFEIVARITRATFHKDSGNKAKICIELAYCDYLVVVDIL